MANRSGSASRRLIALVIAAWLAAVVIPPTGLAWWRAGRLAALSDPTVQADWTAFRDAMKQESDRSGPVQRKVPKSVEPPELVWLRDYFWLAVAAWVVLGGTLGGFLAIAILGVAGSRVPSGPGSSGP
ncbi:MAG: hypothetical protein ACKOCX_06450 [Planctomycetota bacterium]